MLAAVCLPARNSSIAGLLWADMQEILRAELLCALGHLNQQDGWRNGGLSHLLRVSEGQGDGCGLGSLNGWLILGLGLLLCLSSSPLNCCTLKVLSTCFCPRVLH